MKRSKILIVDDDSKNIFALSAFLRARNFECVHASSTEEALARLTNEPDIGAVLMDIMMPDKDGYEAIEEIKNKPSLDGIPVIAVTANAMYGDREKCLEAGADDYISKPINVDKLIPMLHKYIN